MNKEKSNNNNNNTNHKQWKSEPCNYACAKRKWSGQLWDRIFNVIVVIVNSLKS